MKRGRAARALLHLAPRSPSSRGGRSVLDVGHLGPPARS
ncbi:Hypothetical protein A7982_05704 [Minicystis rosea]|nr:Hypothetical protein A7982_05704 [Minicystis rosea]